MTLFDIGQEPERGRNPPLLCISLAGVPVAQGRPRARIVKPRSGPQFVSVYEPAESRAFKGLLRAAAIDAMRGKEVLDGPLDVIVFAFMPIPESWSGKKRTSALTDEIRPVGRPDGDNIGKACMDALNPVKDARTGIRVPIVWRDDSLVVDGRVVKIYAARQPGIVIEIRHAGPPLLPWGFSR